jgi:hypothetical protein
MAQAASAVSLKAERSHVRQRGIFRRFIGEGVQSILSVAGFLGVFSNQHPPDEGMKH